MDQRFCIAPPPPCPALNTHTHARAPKWKRNWKTIKKRKATHWTPVINYKQRDNKLVLWMKLQQSSPPPNGRLSDGCSAPTPHPAMSLLFSQSSSWAPNSWSHRVGSPVTYDAPVYRLVYSWSHGHSFRIPSLPVLAPDSCVPASVTLNHFWELTGWGEEARDIGPSSDTQHRTSWGNADISE